MFGIGIPARAYVIPAAVALGAFGIVALLHPRHHAAPAPAVVKRVTPAPKPPAPEPAPAPAPVVDTVPVPAPAFDLVAALQAIGQRSLPPAVTDADPAPSGIQVLGACTRPSARQKKKLVKQLAAWADFTYATENPDGEVALDAGCLDPEGVIVNAHQDRSSKHTEQGKRGRWWMLRIHGETITVLAERTSSSSDDWMEWADEGTLGASALIDLDHDGVRDIVWMNVEHEGGAMRSDYAVSAMLSKSGATTPIVQMTGELGLQLAGADVVLELGDRYDHLAYRCLDAKLKLGTCAAADRIRAKAEHDEIAARYAAMTATTVPDRELLAEELVKLGVHAAERAPLVAAAPATRPDQRAPRDVARFVAKIRSDDDLTTLVQSSHDEAVAYFTSIRSQLGDTTCVAQPPSAADAERVNAWIATQPFAAKGKRQPPQAITIVPACGSYLWAAWEDWAISGETGIGVRHEALLALGADLTRVVGFEFPATGDPQMGSGSAHASTFYRHGDTIVGEVIHFFDDHMELFAITNGRVVAKRKGTFALYTYDARWTDTSDDLILEAPSTWWHATPTGLERIDPEPLQAHEAKRAAIELLEGFDPMQIATKAAYLHALKTLGAAPALVREVRDL